MKYYIGKDGKYIGSFEGVECEIEGATEVPFPPDHASQKWDGVKYLPYEKSIQDQIDELESSITKRSFREAFLGDQKAIDKIKLVDAQIGALRS